MNNTDNFFLYLKTKNTDNNLYDDTQMTFTNPLLINNHISHIHEMAILRINTYLNLVNITAGTTFTYHIAGVPYVVNFEEGNYDLGTIDTTIKYTMTNNGHNTNLLGISPNFSTSKINILLGVSMKIDFTLLSNARVASMLGFNISLDNTAGLADVVYTGANKAKLNEYYDVNNTLVEINKLYIHCDLFKSLSYTNMDSELIRQNNNSIMYSFSLNGITNTLLEVENNNISYVKLSSHSSISTIRFYLTNELNVKLRGVIRAPLFMDIHFRKSNIYI